jgi:hypothetical protein
MEDTAVPGAPSPGGGAPWPFPRRFVALFTSPKALFEELERRPSWFVPFVISLLLVILYSVVLWNPVILPEMLARFEEQGTPDSAVQTMTSVGLPISIASAVIIGGLFTFVVAWIVQVIGGFLFGGSLSYKQALSVVAHTSLVSVPAMVVLIPLALVAKTAQVSVGPGMLFPSAQAEGFAAKFISFFLSSVDVFRLWQVALTAVGISVIGRIPRGKAMAGLFTAYFLVALIGSAISAMMGR